MDIFLRKNIEYDECLKRTVIEAISVKLSLYDFKWIVPIHTKYVIVDCSKSLLSLDSMRRSAGGADPFSARPSQNS